MKIVKRATIKQGSAWKGGPTVVRGNDGLLANLIPFDSQGAMKARRYDGKRSVGSLGRFSGSYSSFMKRYYPNHDGNEFIEGGPLYVVYSYDTPIAWVDFRGGIVIPDVKYSLTTTHHQNLCRTYINEEAALRAVRDAEKGMWV